jgi:speckle-type POZ protein
LASAQIVTFDSRIECSGFPKFIKREDLEKSKHLKDDSFVVRCDIAVITKVRVGKAPSTTSVSQPPPSDLHSGRSRKNI